MKQKFGVKLATSKHGVHMVETLNFGEKHSPVSIIWDFINRTRRIPSMANPLAQG